MSAKSFLDRCHPVASVALSVLFIWPTHVIAKSDVDRFELLGPVKTVVTKYPQLRTTHQFDRNGLLMSLELFQVDGRDSARYVFVHDPTGRVIEEQTFEPDGTVAYKKLFRYSIDEQGRQTALVATTDTGAFTNAEFAIYDDRGFLTEELYVSGQGVIEKDLFDVRGNLSCSLLSRKIGGRGDASLFPARSSEGKPVLRVRWGLDAEGLLPIQRGGSTHRTGERGLSSVSPKKDGRDLRIRPGRQLDQRDGSAVDRQKWESSLDRHCRQPSAHFDLLRTRINRSSNAWWIPLCVF